MKKYTQKTAMLAIVLTNVSFLLLLLSTVFQPYVFALYSQLQYSSSDMGEWILKTWETYDYIIPWSAFMMCVLQLGCIGALFFLKRPAKGRPWGELMIFAALALLIPQLDNVIDLIQFLNKYGNILSHYTRFFSIYTEFLYFSLGWATANEWANNIFAFCMLPAVLAQLVGCVACGLSIAHRQGTLE